MNKPILLTGAPGTGKTYNLVKMIKEIKPDNFAYLAFTRRAANEAKQRLRSYYNDNSLNYCRTIHSLCFRLCGLRSSQVVQWKHIKEFGRENGYEFTPRFFSIEDDTYLGLTDDDKEFREMMIDAASLGKLDSEMRRKYTKFKVDNNNLVDYNDMIAMTVLADKFPKLELLVVDEFQDLTPLQVGFIACLKEYSKQVILAGDANQMIFEWAGVDRQQYHEIANVCDVKGLVENYRLPVGVNHFSNNIFNNKKYHNGYEEIVYLSSLPPFRKGESYLILARNSYLLKQIVEELYDMNVEWSWLSDEYSLGDKSGIKLSTIHAAKGAEADNVILLTDIAPVIMENIDSDKERRVWYVAVTRTKKRLYIMEPRTDCYYDLS